MVVGEATGTTQYKHNITEMITILLNQGFEV